MTDDTPATLTVVVWVVVSSWYGGGEADVDSLERYSGRSGRADDDDKMEGEEKFHRSSLLLIDAEEALLGVE